MFQYNAQNWSPLIKPLSPLQPGEEAARRGSFASIPINQQEQQLQAFQARQRQEQAQQHPQQNLAARPTNNVTKPRSILPAPPANNYSSQPYMMNNMPAGGGPSPPQPPLKLPLPRLTPHLVHQPPPPSSLVPPKPRNRKPSKVVSSVRPTQAVLNQGEDGKMGYKQQPVQLQQQQVPLRPTEHTAGQSSKDTIKPGSITDALRAIDERTIEPPTVSVQRMIEQNESLRRQVELEGFFPLRSTTQHVPTELQLEDAMSPIRTAHSTPSATPTRSVGDCTPTTTPGAASTQSEDTSEENKEQSELNSTNESKEEETLPKKPKKRTSKKSTSQNIPQQQQVVRK